MMKNAFYFTLKGLFVAEIFKFLFWLFGHAEQPFDKKGKVLFKIYRHKLDNKHLQYTYWQ